MNKPPNPSLPIEVNPLERDEQVLDHEPVANETNQKVALDLDDAPFLDDLPEEAPPPKPTQDKKRAGADSEPESEPPAQTSRRFLLIVGVLVAILLAGLAFWFTRPPPAPEVVSLPEAPPVPVSKPVVEEFTQPLDPFWVAFAQDDGVFFLSLRMVLVIEDPTLSLEIQRKNIILRDAVYYFLNNRPLPTLKRADAAEALKTDLMSVMNQHLSQPLKSILIEDYLVQ
ncbi:flagellar FliL protein [Desulfonatronum thiosulfatophilum]|uniref:Flagellar protein FliL n=1 Tax=Desulfonatronum thiosulfatophilum TaxID=617002 RepID=A0A1G6ER40_9BACT|nr:flagellar basal body-associated FliL family protein [Desulfonatronum thiosulfatophilum]SDB59903.1 flagellar FliL protein [Desulfonatronum thiosulfatophilum]